MRFEYHSLAGGWLAVSAAAALTIFGLLAYAPLAVRLRRTLPVLAPEPIAYVGLGFWIDSARQEESRKSLFSAALLGMVAGLFLVALYAAFVAVRRFGHRFAFDLQWARLSMLARESLPFGLTFIISTLYFKIDVPILKFFTTFAAVGVYSAAYKYFEAVVFVPQTLMDPVFPALAQLPVLLRTEIKTALSGNKSLKLTPVAVDGPLLVTRMA